MPFAKFAEKFETVISIPVFTNDELVTFARTYARENGFRMDEMGVLALYTMIGDNQKEDEPITIGKVKEISAFPVNDYTDDGQLLGHIVMGAQMVGERAAKIDGFPHNLLAELQHCILAHHGKLEYGSPKVPALIEAVALNYADDTDAKMETFKEILENNSENSGWLG